MKFDIVRAWKDETYRQTLSAEQRNTLPANPAGELNDTELAAVCGGDGGFGNDFGVGAASSASANDVRTHSFSLLCDISIFSLDKAKVIDADSLINIANSDTRICVNRD